MRYVKALALLTTIAQSYLLVACGPGSEPATPTGLNVTPTISTCGGFVASGSVPKGPPAPDPATYCDAERLHWRYDKTAKTLALLDARVMLNCCGEHSIAIEQQDLTFTFTELDTPQGGVGGTRCKCNCVYDYAATIANVAEQTITLRLIRNITEQMPPAQTIWEGKINLSDGEGEIPIDTTPATGICSP